jgi:hypothetical protein
MNDKNNAPSNFAESEEANKKNNHSKNSSFIESLKNEFGSNPTKNDE